MPAQSWRHGLSLFGELKYPRRLQAFRLRQSEGPARRSGTPGGDRHLRQFQPGDWRREGRDGGGHRQHLRHADGLRARRGLDGIRPAGGIGQSSGRLFELYLPAAGRGQWHDGKPITAEDVIFSFEAFKKYDPQSASYYRHVTKAEKSGERDITFTFDQAGNRELPQIVGQLQRAAETLVGRQGRAGSPARRLADHDGAAARLRSLSGEDFVAGRSITYERVADYWGKDVNVNIGTNNFDELRYEYFRDSTVALEAFKADHVDWRYENSAKDWATAYDFPAVREKRVILEEFDIRNFGIMQAFAFNTRRDKFKDPRVRRAFNFAFDFEEMNKQIFFGQYRRINSFFEGTELASSGLPEGQELEILQTVKDKVPAEVFTTAFTNPKGGDAAAVRNNMREALRLFREAGWEIRDHKLTNVKTGEKMGVEVLLSQPTFERIVSFWKPLLERVGVEVSIRVVDATQYENRQRNWDFDIILASWGQSLSPGNEQRGFWGSICLTNAATGNRIFPP